MFGTPFVMYSAITVMAVVGFVLWLYGRFFRWRETDAGPYIIFALWLMEARLAITVLGAVTPHDTWWAEIGIIGWDLAVLVMVGRLAYTLLCWLRADLSEATLMSWRTLLKMLLDATLWGSKITTRRP